MSDVELVLPPGPFRAYLFDLDGTVADSMPLHYISWRQAVQEQGAEFPEDLFYAWGGIPLPKTVEMLNERFGYNMVPATTARRKEELYLDMLPGLKPITSVLTLIEAQHGRIPFAIVSGSPRASIDRTLTQLGLLDRFEVLVGAPARECLVFEDADAGIKSAEAAGMAWVRIPQRRLDPELVDLATGVAR
jgi:beta-phosphoglucomutase-like phosphatase (HAD superfamily)